MHHPKEIKYEGGMGKLVEDLSNLQYDSLQTFMTLLAKKIQADAIKDSERFRPNLATALAQAAGWINAAWGISEPHMAESPEQLRLDAMLLHCEAATRTVNGWPEWKRRVFGDDPTPSVLLKPERLMLRVGEFAAELNEKSLGEVRIDGHPIAVRTLSVNATPGSAPEVRIGLGVQGRSQTG